MSKHKRHRKGPTCPLGGYHHIGPGYIYDAWDGYRVYQRACTRCGTTWTRWPDELVVSRGPVPLCYMTRPA